MKLRFFKDVKTRAELKKEYVRLLKQYHPDNGGDAETCKVLNVEYEYLAEKLPQVFEEGHEATEREKKAAADHDKLIREVLSKIIHMEGIEIEIVGIWIWIDGNTFVWKDELKKYGFTWSKARKKWHCCPYGESNWYRGKRRSFDTLRAMYGSDKVETEKRAKLA